MGTPSSSPPYIVIRLVPESPVDGATFATYLDGLALQVIDANTSLPRSDLAYSSPLILFQWPGAGGWMSLASAPTSEPTSYNRSAGDYGNTLNFNSTDGIPVGSYVYSSDQTTIPPGSLQVTSVTQGTVQLSGSLSNYVPAGTVVSFMSESPSDPTSATASWFTLPTSSAPTNLEDDLVVLHFADTRGVTIGMGVSGAGVAGGTTVAYVDPSAETVIVSQAFTGSPSSVTFTLNPPFAYVTKTPSAGTPTTKPGTLRFPANATNGIAVGMTLAPVTDLIGPGTTVTSVTSTQLKLSQPLLGPLPSKQAITFTFPLSTGIVQHVQATQTGWNFITGIDYAMIPAAVATAVIPLNPSPPLPDYLDIQIKASRAAEIVPVTDTFYNVKFSTTALPQQPYQYQAIPAAGTSLYISLPAPPGANSISLAMPDDGSAPPFDLLYAAIQNALQNDQIWETDPVSQKLRLVGPPDLVSSSAWCKRIAYDIIWSYQNTLPLPPDPLESLYTNPPNPGGGGGGSNNFEQDRQKFEGNLGSFYSTNNANAERLTKFVAAASAAVACEQASLNSDSALLEFPVDPSATFANAVGSELVVQGVSAGGASGLNFGVPAAFFYALGANLDQTTTAVRRFQMATGDAIERLLQQFATAVDRLIINDKESFTDTSVGPATITPFQAARRLVALGVSAASTSPAATVYAGTALASLVGAWLSALDLSLAEPQNPPLTYANNDFNIWTQHLASTDPAGYLDLDLEALTQGHLIPPVTASPSAGVPSGPVLTFPSALGIGPGMPVSGPNIAPGTTVLSVRPTTSDTVTVTLSAAVLGGITATETLTFNDVAAPASTLADQIAAWLPGTTSPPTPEPTVATLKQVTASQWTALFTVTGSPQWLPPFTQPVAPGAAPSPAAPAPGYIALRIRAFIRAVHQFFTVSSAATSAQLPTAGTPPTLERPSFDPIGQVVADLPGSFRFGTALSSTDLTTAARTVFGDDPTAQAWLAQAMTTIDELWQIASVVPDPTVTPGYSLPDPVSFPFSVMEALYARGFQTARDIANLSGTDFQQALTGTVAYDFASALQAKAQVLAPTSPAAQTPGGAFQPVNPDGSLVSCVPPSCLSPSGPIAYLQELLSLSELSTCEAMVAAPLSLTTTTDAPSGTAGLTFASIAGVTTGMSASAAGIPDGTTVTAITTTSVTLSGALTGNVTTGSTVAFSAPTLATVLSQRRGPVGELAASRANLATPLPLIDIVNECLEYLAAAPATHGTVYNTPDRGPDDHDPARLLTARPEYSTPATPVAANAAVEPTAFNNLKSDFSSCLLPYSQPLDVSRSYLRALGSSRFDEMRTFRACITEFVLDPVNEPTGFQDWLWRYPVRIDVAREYLGITPEEYSTLFDAAPVPPWAEGEGPVGLPAFLAGTGLSYGEFYDLWQAGFVDFRSSTNSEDDDSEDTGSQDGAFPECEPCGPDNLWLEFSDGRQQQDLAALLVFIRLWRTMRQSRGAGYSFAQLRDVCDVLQLRSGGALNPDFVRQLAAFQMLREEFGMELADPAGQVPPTAVDADRTQLLALWAGPAAPSRPWAVRQLVQRVERYAQRHHRCGRRSPEFVRLLLANLDPLSRLGGFDPASATDSWHARPTHTLRFAEVLAKVYASDFSVGELLYLFTADPHPGGDDSFPLQEENDALDFPLGLPDEEREHALWRLREELLAVQVSEGDDEEEDWPWRRIDAALQQEFGFASGDTLALGQHFFPGVLARSGQEVAPAAARFVTSLPAASTSVSTWNDPPDGPFDYDTSAQQLSARLPLTDRAVIAKLTHARDLDPAEQQAVQDLYFAPRAMLAGFALLFADFATAQHRLVEEADETERFGYFRRQFLQCRQRCAVIAEHLSRHVAAVTGRHEPDGPELGGHELGGPELAALIVRSLAADENMAVSGWESDSGTMPGLTWPRPAGGALAALLGLTGTGLSAEYRQADGTVVWRDSSGSLSGFGAERDRENCPVPTVLPDLAAALSPQNLRFASVHNGFLMKDATGAWLGGAQGFTVTWCGALLVDREGTYEFWGGAPVPGEERPGFEAAEHCQWRAVLSRGQRAWVVLSHHWEGEEEHRASALPLKPGAYRLTVEFTQPAPEFGGDDQTRPQHTGFQVKYSGPDSDGRCMEIPHSRLFAVQKDQTLAKGVEDLSEGASAYLGALYVSSLRDIRRTYQRTFKALLLASRLGLSAHREWHSTSELGYLLSQPALFAGTGYYRTGSGFTRHAADFDFDFLPLADNYHPPTEDARTAPSAQRVQAMFDWWERLCDYSRVRAEVRRRGQRQLWHLFEEARENQPADASSLLRHLGADARDWPLELRYFQGQDVPVQALTSTDLADERWTLRAWHADRWLRAARRRFATSDPASARPDLWASDDPSRGLPGESETGNANLVAFVTGGCLDNGEPRRYDDLTRLNDGLRERGRRALVAYLCQMDRVALPWQPAHYAAAVGDLSDLLLLDVEAGACERASRVEEAITAAQSFIRRARLGLEPGWRVTGDFACLWDSRFETYRTWEQGKRRGLYRENWIEWDERNQARRIEAFRFLESELRSTLTLAAPGGLDWWADDDRIPERQPKLLQQRVPSELRPISPPPERETREGLGTLGRPEWATSPSWLAAGPQPLPLWMESAIALGTRFVRVAAAGMPGAALGFSSHGDPPRGACCDECGREHPFVMDEYYFWLTDTRFYTYTGQMDAQEGADPSGGDASFAGSYQFGFQDSYYDSYQQQSAEWNDEDQVPSLLAKWQPNPGVRLAWCRVHHGQFGQPRTSQGYVAIADRPDLVFLGRAGDSLYFQVSGSAPLPSGYGADTSPPGFRYDLPPDDAVALPQVLAPPAPPTPSPYPGGLTSYPFFAHFDPGARLFPASSFATALAVAEALRGQVAFEPALRWYRRAFDPLQQDCSWLHPTKVTEQSARDRAVLLHYCETLLDWGDALMRRRRSPEAFQQARLIYGTVARITGERPKTVVAQEPMTAPSVTEFVPSYAPINPRLMDLYDKTADRLALIRTCQDARGIRNGEPGQDVGYFGDGPFIDGWRTAPQACADGQEWCARPSPYRFGFQIQKAMELAGILRELGSALLSAYERGDGEYLASVQARQGREILALGLAIQQDQWRDADWQVQALQQTKEISQTNLLYYANLYQAGLINDEIQNLDLTTSALEIRTAANVMEAAGEIMNIIPDSFFGALSSGVVPPIGSKFANFFEAVGRIMTAVADIQSTTAAMDATQADWQRRSAEWFHQMQVLPIEIQQTELQILSAQRRRDQALAELNNAQRQIEHATEVLDFLRDKFTGADLYLWLRKETSALHARMYDLALGAALEAQRAYNFERGHTTRRFIPEEAWDNWHDGLLAGERLDCALRTMEKAYLDENRREYELTKHISLRLQFPAAYLRLRVTGRCQIDIPEWMFDLDYPGQYMRRIKDATLTLACVTGPYTGVHGRLTLLSSMTRIHPGVRPPAHRCRGYGERGSDYEACADDPRIVREYAARESIATSSGQNDSGLFELNFRDERYLPFEYQGAVSRWRFELPPENNYFDLDTVTDVVLHLDYTAQEGGDVLRAAASDDARHRLPGDGLRVFDVRHDFPDAWPAVGRPGQEGADPDRRHRSLRLDFTPVMFPFVPGRRVRTLDRLLLMFQAPDARPGRHHLLRFWWHDAGHERVTEFTAVAEGGWPGYFCGPVDLGESPLGPLRDEHPAVCGFDFPAEAGEIGNIFVIAHYAAEG
jgi:Tc toxin complex TcA C-terminal TcB-binding domain